MQRCFWQDKECYAFLVRKCFWFLCHNHPLSQQSLLVCLSKATSTLAEIPTSMLQILSILKLFWPNLRTITTKIATICFRHLLQRRIFATTPLLMASYLFQYSKCNVVFYLTFFFLVCSWFSHAELYGIFNIVIHHNLHSFNHICVYFYLHACMWSYHGGRREFHAYGANNSTSYVLLCRKACCCLNNW